MNVQIALDKRWSPRAFSDQPVTVEDIAYFAEAGCRVASCFNEQPWRLIIARKEDPHYEKLFSALKPGNQEWAHTAPVLGVMICKLNFDHNGKPNAHAEYDCGAFMTAATLALLERNIYVHQMAGFEPEEVVKAFAINPDQFKVKTAFVLGYLGNRNQLPEKLAEKEQQNKERNKVGTYLFGEKWGSSFLDESAHVNHYDSLIEAIEALKNRGYMLDLRVNEKEQLVDGDHHVFEPSVLDIVEYHRFEGMSNPSDNCIIYAVEQNGRALGIMIDAYGSEFSTLVASIIERMNMKCQ